MYYINIILTYRQATIVQCLDQLTVMKKVSGSISQRPPMNLEELYAY